MPTYNEESAKFWKVSEGALVMSGNKESEPCNVMEGKFTRMYIYNDEGNPTAKPPIPPGPVVRVVIQDDVANIIPIRPGINAASSLVSRLTNLEPGSYVKLKCRPGKENPKVTFFNVHVMDEEENWIPVEYLDMPTDVDERREKTIELVQEWERKYSTQKS